MWAFSLIPIFLINIKKIMSRTVYVVTLSVLFFCGCSRILPPDDCSVTSIIGERIQKHSNWSQCQPTQEAIDYLLGQELTVDSAVQIALLNNPKVQAIFYEIGIAHADLIEAGLFRNPIFDGYVRFPDQSGLVLNTQFGIAQTFLDIFLVPLKKKVAAAELEQTKLRVANALLNLAFDVQDTFYLYVASQQKLSLLEILVEATDIAHRLATLQKKQGNINDLELQVRTNEYLQTKIQYTESKAEWVAVREQMNRLMGLGTDNCWSISQNLPELPVCEIPCECLESIALAKRLDIEVARWEMERLCRFWKTKRWWAFADGTLGVSTEREAENFLETGPAFSIPLPFFNYGQADKARIYALYSQSCNQLKALEISVLTEVRSARGQLAIYRELIEEYQSQLLPLQESIVTTSQHFYNFMALGVYKLIGAKKQAIKMEINYTMALLHYWKMSVTLDRALGGNLWWATKEAVNAL
jgi:outer membrane protein, heavy metal efflux system